MPVSFSGSAQPRSHPAIAAGTAHEVYSKDCAVKHDCPKQPISAVLLSYPSPSFLLTSKHGRERKAGMPTLGIE